MQDLIDESRYEDGYGSNIALGIATVGPGGTLVQTARVAAGIAASRAAGLGGELARGLNQTKTAIDSASQTARNRIPDMLDRAAGVLEEVKNVARLRGTDTYNQLVDYAQHAYENGLKFTVVVRENTKISPQIQQMLNSYGASVERFLPK